MSPKTSATYRWRSAKRRVRERKSFALKWLPQAGARMQEIVRQQWNFSPDGATQEIEDYDVQLSAARVLELTTIPSITGGESFASLGRLKIA